MTTPDYDETTLDRLFAGAGAPSADQGELAVFLEEVRFSAGGPPPAPRPELAVLLTEGPIDPALRRRRKRMIVSEFLAGLAAKLAALGVAGKVALGLGLASASAAGAGAAGALPDAAQHALATVVNATPLRIPDVASNTANGQTVTVPTGSDVVGPGGPTGTDDDPTGDDATDQAADNHGACVAAVAKSAPKGAGGVHGEAVSAAAHSCPGGGGSDDETTTSTSTTIEPVPATVSPTGSDAAEGNHGHGKSGEEHGQSGQSGSKKNPGH